MSGRAGPRLPGAAGPRPAPIAGRATGTWVGERAGAVGSWRGGRAAGWERAGQRGRSPGAAQVRPRRDAASAACGARAAPSRSRIPTPVVHGRLGRAGRRSEAWGAHPDGVKAWLAACGRCGGGAGARRAALPRGLLRRGLGTRSRAGPCCRPGRRRGAAAPGESLGAAALGVGGVQLSVESRIKVPWRD